MIRVVVVEDSAFMRRKISDALSRNKDIIVVGEAIDPYVARGVITQEKPDVITLDIEMPRMDGLTFLGKLMTHHPLPVVVCSSLAREGGIVAMEALRAGAVEVICKPSVEAEAAEFRIDLVQAVLGAAAARGLAAKRPVMQQVVSTSAGGKVVCMGASTGGAVAVEEIIQALPAQCPPIVVAQHLPTLFISAYAQKLDQSCAMRVREAVDGDVVEAGQVILAPGDRHLLLAAHAGKVVVQLKQGPRVNQHRPALDLLFQSAAQCLRSNVVGVILTGSGSDGVAGLLQMRRLGAEVLAQGLSSCAVDCLPAAAISAGAVKREVPLHQLPSAILAAAGAGLVRGAA